MPAVPPISNEQRLGALRIIDANLNRAGEGLRVVEEYCRFILSDRHLTSRCKALRDQLVAATGPLQPELAIARDTQGDVGAQRSFTEEIRPEASRLSLAQIAAVNGERVKQALRAIEEYAKLLDPAVAAAVEAVRYPWYTLEKAVTITGASQRRLAAARLYVLIDGGKSECGFVERVQELVAAGVHVLQLRDKQLDDRTLLARARLLRRIIEGSGLRDQGSVGEVQGSKFKVQSWKTENFEPGTLNIEPLASTHDSPPLFIMNDRPDLAVLARADGVHVGQEELEVRDVRRIVGTEMLVGVSAHTIEQARQAVLDGANYIGCGPTFPSGTKHFDDFPGIDFLREVAAEISLPAFAIGGITLRNLPSVIETGMNRVAVGNAICGAADVGDEAQKFLSELERIGNL